jgi:hypothetical protein
MNLPTDFVRSSNVLALINAASQLAAGENPQYSSHQIAEIKDDFEENKIRMPPILWDAYSILMAKDEVRAVKQKAFVTKYNKSLTESTFVTPCPSQILGVCKVRDCPFTHSGNILNENFIVPPRTEEEVPVPVIKILPRPLSVSDEATLGRTMAASTDPATCYYIEIQVPDGSYIFQGNAFKGKNFFYTANHVLDGIQSGTAYLFDPQTNTRHFIVNHYNIITTGVDSDMQDICKFTIDHKVMLDMFSRPHISFSPTASLNKDRRIVIQYYDPITRKFQMRNGFLKELANGYFSHDIQSIEGYSGCMILDEQRGTVVGIHRGGFRHGNLNCGLSLALETVQKLNELVAKQKNM